MKRYDNQNPTYMKNDQRNFPSNCHTPKYDMDFYDPNYGIKGIQDEIAEDDAYNKSDMDRQYMISLYPELSKRIQNLVDYECDQLEYEGSIIYDEFPDRKEIDQIVMRIYVVIEKDPMISKVAQEVESSETDIESQQVFVPGRNIWLWDNIQIPFLNELFYRRGRRYPQRFRHTYHAYPYHQFRPHYFNYQPYVPYHYWNFRNY